MAESKEELKSLLMKVKEDRGKVKVKVKSLSRVRLFTTPWTVARQAPLSMGILQTRIIEWVAMPFSRRSS